MDRLVGRGGMVMGLHAPPPSMRMPKASGVYRGVMGLRKPQVSVRNGGRSGVLMGSSA